MRAKLLLMLAAAAAAGAASAQTNPQQLADPGLNSVEGPARQATLTRPQPVFAVIGHRLVSGEIKPGEPLMALVDARQPTFSCALSQRGAEVLLSCSDGASAQLKLDAFGCGRSRSGEPASMCVGLTPKYALRRLTAPAGK